MLAARLTERICEIDFDPVHSVTISIGVAQGPQHAASPRELIGCAEAAMMTAKARGKNQAVLFDEGATERPDAEAAGRDLRSIGHMKLLQSLAGKLNRLNDVQEIAATIATELRLLIDYHNCRVFLRDGDQLKPIAFVGDHDARLGTADRGLHDAWSAGASPAGSSSRASRCSCRMRCSASTRSPPQHGGDRRVARRGAAALRLTRHRGDRDLEAGARPVRRGRHPAARGARRAGVGRARECAPLRPAAPGGAERQGAARVPRRGLAGTVVRRDLHAHRRDGGDALRGARRVAVAPGRRRRLLPRGVLRVVRPGRGPLGGDSVDRFALEWREPFRGETALVAPLLEGDGVTGWIAVAKDNPAAAPEEELRLLAAFSYQASVALRKARLYWQQLEAAEIANALLDASRELATADSPEAVLNRTVEVTARVLGTERASLWIQERDAPYDLVPRAWFGGELDDLRTPIAAEHAEKWLQTSEPFLLEPEQVSQINGVPAELMSRLAVAPLRLESGRFGALTAMIGERDLGERRLRLLAGLAHQAKLAIETASHYAMLERTFVSTVEALANALEANDAYTSSHARWITDMALLVGRELSLDRAAMKRLEFGALFHDIGKIGIPSEILRKPGPLTDAEFAIVKEHPELGERILAPIERLADVRPIVRACHERWDGLGYPDGKAGDEIPIEARIVLVCDAYHAMVTDRPYRARLPATRPCGASARPPGRSSTPRSSMRSSACTRPERSERPDGDLLAERTRVTRRRTRRDRQRLVEGGEGLVELVPRDRQRRAAHDDVPVHHQVEAALEGPLRRRLRSALPPRLSRCTARAARASRGS